MQQRVPIQSMQQRVPIQSMQQRVPIQFMQQRVPIQFMQQRVPIQFGNEITLEMLQRLRWPADRKQMIGNRLYSKIQVWEPRLAPKITGMLLEMDNTELLVLLSDERALMRKINEALAVLRNHQRRQANM